MKTMKKVMNYDTYGWVRLRLLAALSRSAKLWNDETYLKMLYRLRLGRKLNLDHPQRLTEKLQWLKLYDRQPRYTAMADKYAAKQMVEQTIGGGITIPLIGVYDHFDDIPFDTLPDRCVLKTTHDSGGMVVYERGKTDMAAARRKLERSLSHDYWIYAREWPYKDIPKRILIEEYVPTLGHPDSVEYKLTCMNGVCKMVTVCTGIPHAKNSMRFNDHYDRDWNPIPFWVDYRNTGRTFEKTAIIEEAIRLSEKLAQGVPYLRVDWYNDNGRLLFGELTFFTHAGLMWFMPDEYDFKLGSWLELPSR